MVKETIEAVRQAEEKAESILRKAGEEADAVLANAKADAKLFGDREQEAAREKAAQAMRTAEEEMTKVQEQNNQDVQREAAALRHDAAQHEAQAVTAVLSGLY